MQLGHEVPTTSAADGGPVRVLLVDATASSSTALAELLREDGYVVECARDDRQALSRLAEFTPDLLVTDLRAPGVDGIELTRRTRQRSPDCAVVVVAVHDALDTAMAALRAGAAGYVVKPIDVGELERVMEAAVVRQRGRRLPTMG